MLVYYLNFVFHSFKTVLHKVIMYIFRKYAGKIEYYKIEFVMI